MTSARLSVGPGEACYVHSTFSTFLLLFEQGVPDFRFALGLANYVAGSGWTFLFFFFLMNKFIYLFIYFGLCWVFVAARGLSLVAGSGGYSSLRCVGFSLRWLLLLWSTGSRSAGFSSCGTWAQ